MRSDEELMRAIQRREPEACDELVRRYYGPICRLASGMLPAQSGFEPQDLAQETFLRVWERADTFRFGRGTVYA